VVAAEAEPMIRDGVLYCDECGGAILDPRGGGYAGTMWSGRVVCDRCWLILKARVEPQWGWTRTWHFVWMLFPIVVMVGLLWALTVAAAGLALRAVIYAISGGR
jgi:hypothetical protein